MNVKFLSQRHNDLTWLGLSTLRLAILRVIVRRVNHLVTPSTKKMFLAFLHFFLNTYLFLDILYHIKWAFVSVVQKVIICPVTFKEKRGTHLARPWNPGKQRMLLNFVPAKLWKYVDNVVDTTLALLWIIDHDDVSLLKDIPYFSYCTRILLLSSLLPSSITIWS